MKNLVKQRVKKLNLYKYLLGFFLGFIIICIAINPSKYSTFAFKGLEVWAKILVPALLPFFILTKLFSSTGITDDLSIIFKPFTNKFFKCSSDCGYIFFMSIITGYPVGSKLISDYYNSGKITRQDAIKCCSFCSNSGPMFIVGSVGVGMLLSVKIGYIMLISHIIGAILNGCLYRNYKITISKTLSSSYIDTNLNFSESIMSSINSILLIGGVICFTFVITAVFTESTLFYNIINWLNNIGLNGNLFKAIFSGIFEITNGCLVLSTLAINSKGLITITCFIISFGGISTMLQAFAFLKNIISVKLFVLMKFTHAILSSIICYLLLFI